MNISAMPIPVGGFSTVLGRGRGRGSAVRELPGEAASRMILTRAKHLPSNSPYQGDLSRLGARLPKEMAVVLSTPWFRHLDGRAKRWHVGVAQGGASRHEWIFFLFSATERDGTIRLETEIKSRALAEPLELLNDTVACKQQRGYSVEGTWRPLTGRDFLSAVQRLAVG
jgi:hypothetical protein